MTVQRKTNRPPSRTRNPAQQREVAAARLERRTLVVLERALEKSGMTQARLAEVLEVSPGRVSQIFGEASNMTLASVARVLSALGFDAVISAISIQDGSRIDPRVRVGHRRVAIDAYEQTYVSDGKERGRLVFVAAGDSPDLTPRSAPRYLGTASVSPSDFSWDGTLARKQFTNSALGESR